MSVVRRAAGPGAGGVVARPVLWERLGFAQVTELSALPGATIRSLDPPELRDVIAIVAAPHDELLRRFTGELKQRGLPGTRTSPLVQPGPPPGHADGSGPARPVMMPRHAHPVAAHAGSAP